MFLRAVGGTTVVLAGSVTLGAYTSPAIKARLEAADRAAALGGCVAIMALDYMRVDERIPSILSHQLSDGASATVLQRASKARKELAAAQLEQEKSGIELELALGRSGGAPRRMDSSGASVQVPHSVKDARMRCDAAKERMLRAATDLAEAEAACGADGITRLHKRNAKRLIAMARRNGGCYLKLAQHLAQLGHLLPPEYVTEAQTCLDDCPKSSTSDVRKVIEEELGASPEKLFDEFSHQPIASASLAQVHIARTKGEDNPGRKIAIKVQHRGLRETCVGDLEAVGLAVRLVAHAFPAFRLGWLVDEVAPHLPLELDFKHEAKNCRRAAKIFEKWEDVVVPEVLEATPRVLVMSFEEGICLNASNNRAGMNEAGIDSAATARLVGKSWLHQTFYHGFCHCDPHAGNLLVRPLRPGSSRPQIVLLDHGLYRSLDDDFRLQYAEMWRSLVMGDGPAIEKAARKLGVGDAYPLFSAILTQRPWDDIIKADIDSLRGNRGAADEAMIRAHAQKYLPQITKVLDQCPRQLLLLLKMIDCLRAIDRNLGATHNQHVATADVCCDALLVASGGTAKGLWQWLIGKSRLRVYELRTAISTPQKARKRPSSNLRA